MLGSLLNITKRDLFDLAICLAGGTCSKVLSQQSTSWPDLVLKEDRFIVFDTETTGFNCHKGDEIISIGAVVIEKGRLTENSFTSLVNPKRNIPTIVAELTGINDDMVVDSPEIMEVLDNFLEFTRFSVLIAHHAQFDLGFINKKLCKYCGHMLNMPVIDTYVLSHLLFPYAHDRSLDNLAHYYDITLDGRHTALGDSIITAQVFLKMLDDLENRGIKTTTQLLSNFHFNRLF
ncbi:hypothetical protein JCM17380_40230 [Desulfosporosinus burensis]